MPAIDVPVFPVPTLSMIAARFSGVRIVADIHGDIDAFEAAVVAARAQNLFLVSLGDLVDYGPQSVACLRLMYSLVASGAATMLLGNHDFGLLRHIQDVRANAATIYRGKIDSLGVTLAAIEAQPDADLLFSQARDLILDAPIWLRLGRVLMAHGCYHIQMDQIPPPTLRPGTTRSFIAPTIYGYTDGTERDGYPVRSYEWLDFIDPDTTMVVGHDIRSKTAPVVVPSLWNGTVVFLDTGAGKGGFLSHMDLSIDDLGQAPEGCF